MRCVSCEHENPEGATGCERCGAQLSGGLQRVTILCADLQGSTALAARVDAETYHEIIDGILRILPRLVHEAEGTVNQFTGDGIIAFFQGPDHAPRALLAALAIQTALREYIEALQERRPVALNFRVGINTGELFVGLLGDGLRSDYAQGPAMTLAQRIESATTPGQIFVSSATHAAVGGAFRLSLSGELEGQPLYQVDGAAPHVSLQLKERPATAYTPKHLAEAILHNRRAMEGEHKEVTILFAKLLGTMTMATTLDASTCHEILEQELERMFEAVHEVEGTVNQFTGDGIMALFGAPIAHEDHVQRALAAAISIQKKLRTSLDTVQRVYGITLDFRIGINTGAVVVGKIGDDLRMDYTAKGFSTNLAQRMESLAKPGQIVVSSEVRQRAGMLFRFRGLGAFRVKGAAEELSVYSLESVDGRATRLESSISGAGSSAFLGRTGELSTLRSCWEKAQRGELQLVSLVGEAGVGKSRLLYQFIKELSGVRCLTVQALSYGNSLLYHPFRLLLCELLGVVELAPEEARERLLALCSLHQLDEMNASFLALLFGGEMADPRFSHLDSVERRQRLHAAVLALLSRVSRAQPTLLLLEDVHWLDAASRELLGELGALGDAPLLLLSTARSGFQPPWAASAAVTTISLAEFSRAEALALIEEALSPQKPSLALSEMLLRRGGGNPLFLEELLRALQSGGLLQEGKDGLMLTASHTGLPSTLRSLFAARLDRLDEDVKQVALTAAAFGVEAPELLLERVVEQREELPENCQELSRQAITIERLLDLHQRPYLRFTNALLQEAAYASLLRAQRQALHLKIAEAIEGQSGEVERPAEMLAFHLQRSPQPLRAVPYLRRASQRARAVSALASALSYLQDALRILDEEGASAQQPLRVEVMLEQEQIYEVLGERQQQRALIEQLSSLLRNDREVQGGPAAGLSAPAGALARYLPEVFLRSGDLFAQTGHHREAEPALLTSLSMFREVQEQRGEAKALRSLGFLRWNQERFAEAIAMNQEALALDRTLGDSAVVANDLNNLGTLLRYQREYQGALAYLHEALSLYEGLGNPAKQGFILYNTAHIYRDTGDLKEATLRYHRAYDLLTKGYDLVMSSRALNALAELHLERGAMQDAVALYLEIIRVTREVKYGHGLSFAVRALADLLLILHREDEALPLLQESASLFSGLQDRAHEAEALGKLAALYEARGAAAQAIQAREQQRQLCAQLNDSAQGLLCLQALARLSRRSNPAASLRYLQEARQLAGQLGDAQSMAALLNSSAVLHFSQKQFEEALASYREALPWFQKLDDPPKLGLLLNSLCATLLRLKRFDEASTASQEAARFNQEHQQATLAGHSLAMLGDALAALLHHQGALDSYGASLALRRETADEKGAAWMLCSMSQMYLQLQQREQASASLDEAKRIATRLGEAAILAACQQFEASWPR